MAIDKAIERAHNQKQAKRRYYEKNKEELNRKRNLMNSMPKYAYNKAKWRAENKGQEWSFTEDEYLNMWFESPRILDEVTGFLKTAWSRRGSNPATCTQMVRKDINGPWSVDNCQILYRGEPIPEEEARWADS